MSNVCMARYHGIPQKSVKQLCPGRRTFESKHGHLQRRGISSDHGSGSCRSLSIRPAQFLSTTALPVVCPPSSLVLSAHITPFDAPQRSDEWFALRKDKLTTSTFSTALGFWKGNRRQELWNEKVFVCEAQIVEVSKRGAMDWGVLNEAAAIDRYKSITGDDVSQLGFAVHSAAQYDWLGASPDGLLDCYSGGGILEVKCPFNKGKPETAQPWSTVPFYYMPQVQGQMEIMDREWVNVYCWTPNGSTIFRVHREHQYWEFIHRILREFWWENVIPAKDALLLGREEEANSYKPASTHKQTGFAIAKSIKLASEAKLLCREIAGHVEFYR
ncbi:hypothetical protein HS088_TW06G00670 [Tripterygium wilfordii]|uniref:YqaJ viral recombinase domain-containing protein n=1 Tax=Tripterygium wilfordii TaxID=458696 RepID=A0A7J7DJM8_TRIWF|nr:uncharacterized protein LOC119999536 [Tripterygium wilfordii]XP_038703081.1 uncharacterized protein LOC119999536 [Tripterygium wilfordii]XP_038703082.1 uncharacterized protein LOC119999536 [Tripterygium wilfordii]XP_038703083.1 uncharacterized protein LOC119999536 [Tripterygium wilfordii]KAF5746499.1 hypothetical protein HS088_TW06G00670 [Tripterygium wilfordii]